MLPVTFVIAVISLVTGFISSCYTWILNDALTGTVLHVSSVVVVTDADAAHSHGTDALAVHSIVTAEAEGHPNVMLILLFTLVPKLTYYVKAIKLFIPMLLLIPVSLLMLKLVPLLMLLLFPVSLLFVLLIPVPPLVLVLIPVPLLMLLFLPPCHC